MPVLLIFLLALMLAQQADARIQRSAAEVLAFKRANPCPSTGQRRGACPGHHVDHVIPLCAGGLDAKANMQWMRGNAVEGGKLLAFYTAQFVSAM